MGSLELWVNDNLHDVLGMSEKTVGQFLISLAKKSDSAETFIKKLEDSGTIDVTDRVASFASELFSRVRSSTIFTRNAELLVRRSFCPKQICSPALAKLF